MSVQGQNNDSQPIWTFLANAWMSLLRKFLFQGHLAQDYLRAETPDTQAGTPYILAEDYQADEPNAEGKPRSPGHFA